MHAHLLATADFQEVLPTTITLAPRLLPGVLAQQPLLDFRDLAHLHTHQRIVPLLQAPLMAVFKLRTSQPRHLVLTTLLRLEPWMVLLLGHMVTTRLQVVPRVPLHLVRIPRRLVHLLLKPPAETMMMIQVITE